MRFEKRSLQVVFTLLVLSSTFLSAKNLSGIDAGGAFIGVSFVGLVLVVHALALVFNAFFKNSKWSVFNLVMCILISAVLLLSIGFFGLSASLWYLPVAWTLWALGRRRKTEHYEPS